MMTKVLLIYPYFQTGKNQDILFPPLGISSLAARVKEEGISVKKLDCTFLTLDAAVSTACEYMPDIIGIYIMTTMSQNALVLLDKIKQSIESAIYIAGGPLPSLYPTKFAEKFDFVFQGEAAISFPDFCVDYSKCRDKESFFMQMDSSRYPGIYSQQIGGINEPPMHLSEEEINKQPNPDRNGFCHEMYQKLGVKKTGRKTASIMMTYGCPYHCDFCSKPIFGEEVRCRSLDRIFEEIHEIILFGYDSLWIADDTFTCNEGFLKDFCQRLIDEDLNLSWSCLSRVDGMSDDAYSLMKQSGCQKVYLGIESGNDSVLELMNKGTNTAMIRHAVAAFHENGLACHGFFIVGYPGETVATIEETFAFALSLKLDDVSFNVPYPLPGSKLFDRVSGLSADDWTVENETRFLYESEFDANWLQQRIEETIDAAHRPVSAEVI
jgi:anaerobic magnesium-protoporphyrin IX monomethyl ester cyclase